MLSDVIFKMVEGQRGEWNNRVSNQHHSSAKSIWTIQKIDKSKMLKIKEKAIKILQKKWIVSYCTYLANMSSVK